MFIRRPFWGHYTRRYVVRGVPPVDITGTIAIVDQSDVDVAFGTGTVPGAISVSEVLDASSVAGIVGDFATLAATEDLDIPILAGIVGVGIIGTVVAYE